MQRALGDWPSHIDSVADHKFLIEMMIEKQTFTKKMPFEGMDSELSIRTA